MCVCVLFFDFLSNRLSRFLFVLIHHKGFGFPELQDFTFLFMTWMYVKKM